MQTYSCLLKAMLLRKQGRQGLGAEGLVVSAHPDWWLEFTVACEGCFGAFSLRTDVHIAILRWRKLGEVCPD